MLLLLVLGECNFVLLCCAFLLCHVVGVVDLLDCLSCVFVFINIVVKAMEQSPLNTTPDILFSLG